ncbi:hypothetical protein HDU76_001904, partial [Blyttiomyces sp. JEL0837]
MTMGIMLYRTGLKTFSDLRSKKRHYQAFYLAGLFALMFYIVRILQFMGTGNCDVLKSSAFTMTMVQVSAYVFYISRYIEIHGWRWYLIPAIILSLGFCSSIPLTLALN